MIAEFGLFCLILALAVASMLVIIPGLGLHFNRSVWINTAPYYVVLQFFLITMAYLCLVICFLLNDFTVNYVLTNSSIALPWYYKLCAVWGGHEGSMLLWMAILSFWMLLVAFLSKGLNKEMHTRVLIILGCLSIGFIVFLLCTSNPFLRQFQVMNASGRDLNPLLQDPGFLFHPPMLYMGYVGFSVAFAFAIAALWAKEVEASWSKWARPWTLAAWCCLTAGITLGSWWAYRELGWGGWWFWDPVENASFMPWLVGTALIHSLAVAEQRQQFKAWTILLAISAFSLSLIGTFLVRSGVLTSVHAFAVDPQRGLYILGFLACIIGGSLLLFLFRSQSLANLEPPNYCSRESALLLNNVFLVVIMLTVLLGTVYPLLVDGLGFGKLSVGAPYFNAVFVPLMLPLLILMGIGIHLRWRSHQWILLFKQLRIPFLLSVLIPLLLIFSISIVKFQALVGLIFAFWVIFNTAVALFKRISERGLRSIGGGYWGMIVAHSGVAITVIGISLSQNYGIQKDVLMHTDSELHLAGYEIRFINQSSFKSSNYKGTRVAFLIKKNNTVRFIYPEKRLYEGNQLMTEAAIDISPLRDIYIALGEQVNHQSWTVRIYYKPFIRWIWGGGFMILAGGLLALADRRYYQKKMLKCIMKAEPVYDKV